MDYKNKTMTCPSCGASGMTDFCTECGEVFETLNQGTMKKELHSYYWGEKIEREWNPVDAYQHWNYYAKGKTFTSLKAAKDYIYNSLHPNKKR